MQQALIIVFEGTPEHLPKAFGKLLDELVPVIEHHATLPACEKGSFLDIPPELIEPIMDLIRSHKSKNAPEDE